MLGSPKDAQTQSEVTGYLGGSIPIEPVMEVQNLEEKNWLQDLEMIASVAGLDCFQLWFFLDYCRNQIVKYKVSTTTIKSTNESITYQLQQELTTNSMTPRTSQKPLARIH